ncbi:MAG: carboxylesterase family protein [Acidimicrobiia bacterium]|nr:carboxylesterase family protein [Acidimicrobiia bacterium]
MTTRLALSSGAIEGIRLDTGITAFLGVPYAAPPVGDRRFRPPAPMEPWEGVRPAASLGAAPMQGAPAPGRFLADLSSPYQSEDCLNLNVWTPSADPAARLPVMVWIYGGAFVAGSNAVPAYDGSRLAARECGGGERQLPARVAGMAALPGDRDHGQRGAGRPEGGPRLGAARDRSLRR